MRRIITILLVFCSLISVGQFRLPTVNLRNGLVMYMKFEETIGTTAFDETKNSNDGTINGATINQTGKIGKCYSYNGTSNSIAIGNIGISYPFCVSSWVKHNGTTSNSNIFSASSGTDAFYHSVYLDYNGGVNDNIVIRSYDGTVRDNAYQYNFTSGEWLHIVAVWESAISRKLYFNGALVATGTISVSGIGLENVTIGVSADNTPTNYFGGYIDDTSVYYRALSLIGVKQLYNSGNGLLYVYENYLNDGDFEKFNNYAKEYFALNK